MEVPFVKFHGAGNDFILVDEFNSIRVPEKDKGSFVIKYSNRHFGVGADGVIFVQRPSTSEHDAKFVFYNPDGRKAEMCGNGIRCFAKYLYEKGLVKKERMNVETVSGTKIIDLMIENGKVPKVKVDMGVSSVEFTGKEIRIDGTLFNVSSVNMGNPHAILFVEDLDGIDVVRIGRKIRNYQELFPNGTNVHFVQKSGDNVLRIRTYERGVEDETLACGTGICASAVAAAIAGIADANRPLTFHARGGDLSIELKSDFMSNKRVYMTGPAEEVFRGEVSI